MRERDHRVDAEVMKWMDKNFYPSIGATIVRHEDRAMQLAGVDVSLTLGDLTNVAVDEKAATHYINKNLQTYSFELSSIQNGILRDGWFLRDDLKTQFYMLIYLSARNEWDVRAEDITGVDAILVSKKALQDYMAKRGWPKERLMTYTQTIRDKGVGGAIDRRREMPYYFSYSDKFVEKPVNLIIRREQLEALATDVFRVDSKK